VNIPEYKSFSSMLTGSINVYGKNPVGLTKISPKYLTKSKLLLNQAFERRAEKLKSDLWKKFENEFSEVGYTLIHSQDGIGSACFKNTSKDKKARVKFNIEGENISECKLHFLQNFQIVTIFLVPMRSDRPVELPTEAPTVCNSFSDFKNIPKTNSLNSKKFKSSRKNLKNSEIFESEINKADKEGEDRVLIKNKVVDLLPGETKVFLYQMTEVKSKAKMVNKVTFIPEELDPIGDHNLIDKNDDQERTLVNNYFN
jgi:hypothetical protein